MNIRPFHPDDLPAVIQLEQSLFSPEFAQSRLAFRQNYDLCGDLFQVVQCGQQVVGYLLVALSANGVDSWVLHVAVKPKYQRQGLAMALFNKVFQLLQVKGVPCLWLTVDPANQGAVQLYQRLGFVMVTQEVNYYGLGEQRLLMRHSYE